MMKILLCLYLLFVIVGNATAASDTIGWSNQRLQWSNFKGKWDTATYNKNHFATTFWKLTYFHRRDVKTGEVEVIAYAWFDGRRSWVRPSQRTNTALLRHEQGHFDLAEILARQFKKKVAETRFRERSYADSLNSIFNMLLTGMNDRQARYDIETAYGEKPIEQRRWETSIIDTLTLLSKYADRSVLSKE